MLPTLAPGDRLVVVGTRRVRPGDLVVVPDPRCAERVVVKRAIGVTGGFVEVAGDNPAASTDSRVFGPVALDAVEGRAVYRYAPRERAGSLRRSQRPRG